jgi:hypothetical protein
MERSEGECEVGGAGGYITTLPQVVRSLFIKGGWVMLGLGSGWAEFRSWKGRLKLEYERLLEPTLDSPCRRGRGSEPMTTPTER